MRIVPCLCIHFTVGIWKPSRAVRPAVIGEIDTSALEIGYRASFGHGERQTRGRKAKCCRCGRKAGYDPLDTVIWSWSGRCEVQCEKRFGTQPDETPTFDASPQCDTDSIAELRQFDKVRCLLECVQLFKDYDGNNSQQPADPQTRRDDEAIDELVKERRDGEDDESHDDVTDEGHELEESHEVEGRRQDERSRTTCSRYTGQTCYLWSCHHSRNAVCLHGKCVCGSLECAKDGVCHPQTAAEAEAARRPKEAADGREHSNQAIDDGEHGNQAADGGGMPVERQPFDEEPSDNVSCLVDTGGTCGRLWGYVIFLTRAEILFCLVESEMSTAGQ